MSVIVIHITNRGSYVDILFEGEVVSLVLEETFDPFRPIHGSLDEALKFVFDNAKHYEKDIVSASTLPPSWFDPTAHIESVKEFRKGEEGFNEVFQLMMKACL